MVLWYSVQYEDIINWVKHAFHWFFKLWFMRCWEKITQDYIKRLLNQPPLVLLIIPINPSNDRQQIDNYISFSCVCTHTLSLLFLFSCSTCNLNVGKTDNFVLLHTSLLLSISLRYTYIYIHVCVCYDYLPYCMIITTSWALRNNWWRLIK